MSRLVQALAKVLMPPPTCNKCRSAVAAEGDAWCLGCSAWEATGRELSASWDSTGARLLASDLVVNTCRQVRALRSLAAGLTRQEDTRGAGSGRASRRDTTAEGADLRSSLPRRRRAEVVQPKDEEESEEEEEYESDEEEEEKKSKRRSRTPVKRHSGGDRRPPEPDYPPGSAPGTSKLPRTLGRAERHSADTGQSRKQEEKGRTRRTDKTRRRGKHRAGRKHKRLHRLAEDPTKIIHRALGGSTLELLSLQPGAIELGRLGR